MPLYHGAEFQSCWAPIRGSLLFTHSSRWTIRRSCVFFRLGAFPSKSPLAGFAFFVPQTQNLQSDAKEKDEKKKNRGKESRSESAKSVSRSPHTSQGTITHGFKRVCIRVRAVLQRHYQRTALYTTDAYLVLY